jgi:hypothetical protein
MFMKNHYPRKKNSAPVPRSRWLAGMVAGQLLGFAVALVIAAPIVPVAVLASTVAGGLLGGIAGASLKSKPVEDRYVQKYVFVPLLHRNDKLNDNIKEEFQDVAATGGGERDRRAMKAELKLAPPAPAPPRM